MTRTHIDISKRMLFVYCMLGGLIFLFLPPRITGELQLHYANLFRVPLSFGRGITQSVTYKSRDPLAQEIESHRADNLAWENKYANLEAQLEEARKRIDELAGLRKNPQWSGLRFLPADVMTDPTLGQNDLLIACGQEDEVAKDQYVMADYSIIGQISQVTANTARVRLITALGAKIPVQIAGVDTPGIMMGRGDGTAGINLSTKTAKSKASPSINKDSVVRAISIPGAPGISIVTAKVTECRPARKDPFAWDISVKPACDLSNLKSVFVIVPRKNNK